MSLVDATTGELVELDAAAAERRAERIRLRLDAIADNYTAVMPLIREAIENRDDLALGYRSPGDYVADRFGAALTNLGVDVRRVVVKELTEAGLSTRAIAPVVGVHHDTVARDARRRSGVVDTTPEPTASEPAEPRPVTGIDGKTYSPKPSAPKPQRRALTSVATEAGWDVRKAVEKIERIVEDDRFSANKEQVAVALTAHLTYAVEVCQDLLDRITR